MYKVLISDKMSEQASEIFKNRGIDLDVQTGLDESKLISIIDQYDGLAIRSSTKVTKKVLSAAKNLKVIGRAGIGVDNIDTSFATQSGVVVMNTPFGNAITTAEHSISMMMALARQIPNANHSTHQGKWEKSKFMGVELYNKKLGLIGCGNIGSIVADRARGLKMHVFAYDPYLSNEHAVEIGVKKVGLTELLNESDFITLHTPLNDQTKNIINLNTIKKMKKGVRIINCARGGLLVEEDVKTYLLNNHIAGLALDVYESEPAKDNILFGMDSVVCTPHLGASTIEAQENVALQIAEQISDYLLNGTVTNALNIPSVSAEDSPRLKPYMDLAEQLGSFLGQITRTSIKNISISYSGQVGELNTKPLSAIALKGLLSPLMENINMVNARIVAKDRNIEISEIKKDTSAEYNNLISISITTERQVRSVSGTLFASNMPRLINVNGINLEAEISKHMLYVINDDKPGFIGSLGTVLGKESINIGSFHLGRKDKDGNAVALLQLDQEVNEKVLEQVRQLPYVHQAKNLIF